MGEFSLEQIRWLGENKQSSLNAVADFRLRPFKRVPRDEREAQVMKGWSHSGLLQRAFYLTLLIKRSDKSLEPSEAKLFEEFCVWMDLLAEEYRVVLGSRRNKGQPIRDFPGAFVAATVWLFEVCERLYGQKGITDPPLDPTNYELDGWDPDLPPLGGEAREKEKVVATNQPEEMP